MNLSGYDKAKERESALRYVKEAASIEKGLYLSEEQMEELKTKTGKEFQKQTSG